MGIGFIVSQDNPFGCAPKTNHSHGGGEGPDGGACPPDLDHGNHYHMNPCDNYVSELALPPLPPYPPSPRHSYSSFLWYPLCSPTNTTL